MVKQMYPSRRAPCPRVWGDVDQACGLSHETVARCPCVRAFCPMSLGFVCEETSVCVCGGRTSNMCGFGYTCSGLAAEAKSANSLPMSTESTTYADGRERRLKTLCALPSAVPLSLALA